MSQNVNDDVSMNPPIEIELGCLHSPEHVSEAVRNQNIVLKIELLAVKN
jgi:hypothetical protein